MLYPVKVSEDIFSPVNPITGFIGLILD